MMMQSCRPSCLGFPVTLVYFQVNGCSRHLYRVCQGEYELLNGIDFDKGERDIWTREFLPSSRESLGLLDLGG